MPFGQTSEQAKTTPEESLSTLRRAEDNAAMTNIAQENWAVQKVKETYRSSKELLPMPEQYKDVAMISIGVVAGVAACKPLLSKALANGAEIATRAEGVMIVPLTHENLPAAIKAGKDGFRYGWPILNPAKDFRASLESTKSNLPLSMNPKVESNSKYWLAVDKNGNVLGTTGLYESGKDASEAAWLGWMSVRSAYRGQGIGKLLVEHSIEQAKLDGKQYLRLYTSNARGEHTAQSLYEKHGLKIVGSEPHPIPRVVQRIFGEKKPLQILYRELELKPNGHHI
ncbi:GNAT family N-acetyltransferase [bacterium]|nr:GNAT family N-acetyltransferase [bacterium]MBP9811325.1 GNAT family N-acetyltransferase [bacterium]